jgi:hypothetical protein
MRVASARTGSLPDGALAPVTIDEVLFIFSQTASPNGARGIDGHDISWIAARLRPTVATKADRLHLVTLASLTLPAAITQIQAYLANQRVRAPPRWSSAYTIGGVPESGSRSSSSSPGRYSWSRRARLAYVAPGIPHQRSCDRQGSDSPWTRLITAESSVNTTLLVLVPYAHHVASTRTKDNAHVPSNFSPELWFAEVPLRVAVGTVVTIILAK